MTGARWPDLAGRIVQDAEGQRHILPVRVYFEDTDAGGVVYHASYVRFAERGRTDFLRLLGTDARRMIDGTDSREPAAFVVRRMSFDFARPARMDDLLEVETRVKELGAASVTLDQRISRDGVPLVSAEVVVVLVSISGKPLRLSDTVRKAFEAHAEGRKNSSA
ncbi:tol-pal system-associated acyl-CoA thioesterase [Hyphomicrobium sp. 2TAF46]|uniref:tol-pal system-associated acyl-CoA thioesterase n=1 Tax=Hyphomicrobium sp. 2TAF46 TaxID=3233019 RepID=UPI003F900FCF|nr:tol-pal system-associated acyl-CoA thioesterase [Pseudomonadota bacterium]